jgi:hypothetical protein
VPELLEKNIHIESNLRETFWQPAAATSWLRRTGSAEPRVPTASCAMHVHYRLYDYSFGVKISGSFEIGIAFVSRFPRHYLDEVPSIMVTAMITSLKAATAYG